ncbi:MAG: gamma-glutamyl-gamma-aminobutyrate hydrolase family protein [Proteobacteria bacterium]|nr:gamma-glutamyl-gamma-aminobutyrate hydrolase family protein [Pseudomonadota bacterium]
MAQYPLIGITFDTQAFNDYPWYALRKNYCTAIADAGGIPFPLTHDLRLTDKYISLINGLMITGGEHDVDPLLYGVRERHPTVNLKPHRTAFEMEIARAALKKNLPVFGICGGQQLINVVLGGTLIQHIPDEVPQPLEHVKTRHLPCHTIQVARETLLHQIVEKEEFSVNSGHHQAIKEVAPGVIINAVAPDGVIEGIESPAYRFCLGVQWHPEFIITPHDASIFQAFIEASRE